VLVEQVGGPEGLAVSDRADWQAHAHLVNRKTERKGLIL
jgi:hypothetical protein